MRKKIISFWMLFLFLFGDNCVSHALEVETHRAINEYISSNTLNGFSLSDYLNNNFGFTKGKEEEINGQKVYKWFGDGGKYEDIPAWYLPYLRSVNHFHNPIAEQGFSGFFFGALLSGESSTVWAQKAIGTQSPGGYYSWYDVRDYYQKALTSTDFGTRSTYFAETFRGMGQLMHLIQDASVPAHTRNDAHLLYNYEDWVDNIRGADATTFQNLLSNQVFFNGTITNIASFIDTNQYNGTNPSNSNGIGLAEYTNANFFSEDTIFKDFPHPAKDETDARIIEVVAEDGGIDKRYYVYKTDGGYNLAAYSYFADDIDQSYGGQIKEEWKYILDEEIYKDYASLLLPRAVGYSASLLNYFFRGQMNIEKDPNNGSLYVIKNESSEYMSGTFTLYYDDINDNRRYLTSWNKSINPNSQSDSVSFTEPTDAKEKGKYILVFQGIMGNETGAVVGKAVEIEGCIEKGDVKIVVTADGILMQTNCRGELVRIGTIDCISSNEKFLTSVSKGNNQFNILTTAGQGFYLYTVDITDKIMKIGESWFRKIECRDKQTFTSQSSQYSYGEPGKTVTGEGSLAGSNNCSEFTATATYTTSVMWTEAVGYQFYQKNNYTGSGNYTDDLPFVFERISWSAGSQVTTTNSIIKNMIGDITGEQGDCTMSVYWQTFTEVVGYCNPVYYFSPKKLLRRVRT